MSATRAWVHVTLSRVNCHFRISPVLGSIVPMQIAKAVVGVMRGGVVSEQGWSCFFVINTANEKRRRNAERWAAEPSKSRVFIWS